MNKTATAQIQNDVLGTVNLDSKFVYATNVQAVLELGLASDKNVVLYGRGGHGKSHMSETFFKNNRITPFVKQLGQGSTIEDLFGGLKMKEFLAEGDLLYKPESSWMNYEYVIFEEAFDAPTFVLEQLKDILSSGIFRNNGDDFKIKTKMIVICTNRSKSEIAEDDSLKALMERFPLELKVEWEAYNAENYAALFKKVHNDPNDFFAQILEECNKKTFISPRIALEGLEVYNYGGLDSLCFVSGFTKGVVEELRQKEELLKAKKKEREFLDKYEKDLKATAKKMAKATTMVALAAIGKEIYDFMVMLETLKVADSQFERYEQLQNDGISKANSCFRKIIELSK